MKIVIIGPTLLTRKCIETLARKGETISAIFTLDEKLGMAKSRFAAMDDIAEKNSIPLYKVSDINAQATVEKIKEISPDVIFELGWSQIISPEILKIPRKGCIGVHASLLPKNRGAASLNWALIRGDRKTGVTLFYLAERPDDGDIIGQKAFDIDERDDIDTLHCKSDDASVQLLLENIDTIRDGTAKRIKQDLSGATYTPRRKPEDGAIDWNKTSIEIYNWVRGQTHPFPGAFTHWNGKKIYVWACEPSEGRGMPGEVIGVAAKKGVEVGTNDKSITLKRLQNDGGVEMWADDFAERHGLKKGDRLGQ